MKTPLFAILVLSGSAAAGKEPLSEIVTLLGELKAKVEADGKVEQQSYDKYACWCEQTFERKAKEIEEAKTQIEELTNLVIKLKGEIAAHTAETKQLEKDIALSSSSMSESTTVRKHAAAQYQEEKIELEQCIGALEAAINVLSGAGTTKKAFLGTLQEAQLLSVAAGVKDILGMDLVTSSFTADELDAVRRFVNNPDSYVHPGTDASGLLQLSPASNQIQGILKDMYDSFTKSLEKANAGEGSAQSNFEKLMATKQKELDTLKAALVKETGLLAEKGEKLAESKALLTDTKPKLKADEKLLQEIKASCRTKARQWAQRSHLRTDELAGLAKAIEILSDGQGKYAAAKSSLLQLRRGASPSNVELPAGPRPAVFARLHAIAMKYKSMGLAQVAAMVKTGGQFDKIVAMIDKMVASLRREEADDISHRDRCQAGQTQNKENHADLETSIGRKEADLEHLQNDEKNIKKAISEAEDEIESVKGEMKDRLELRNEEDAAFKKSLADDAAAIEVLHKAIDALVEFYKANKLPLELIQKEPEYTVDKDKAPEVSWEKEGGNYGGKRQSSKGIISILGMLAEDLETEMKTAKKEDAEAQMKYEADVKALSATLKASEASMITLEKSLAEVQTEISEVEEKVDQKEAAKSGNEEMAKALETDCAWVDATFDKRMEARKTEIEGLLEAKNVLAGAESGNASSDLDLVAFSYDEKKNQAETGLVQILPP